ncbi:hypothetical protein ABT288_13675 [Streptomyces sp. NPDC001093]|uniref:hypothetical protein n=1 Tax=Streptomyces sp. NPDC001093 TaxID=3154376 RepID=UPI00331BC76C
MTRAYVTDEQYERCVGIVQRRELAPALMRPMPVEVARVVVEDLLGVAAVEDREPVGALLAC